MGVSVRVNVYGKLEIGVGRLEEADDAEGNSVAAGSVLNRKPVDMPTNEEMGE